ncbi:MAG: hypothetical protein AB7O32_00020 [Vicinamibacterales bacterium]
MSGINWKIGKRDHSLIMKVVARADDMLRGMQLDPIPQLAMDLTACHLNGTKLNLRRLLAAPDFDFFHDVWGIHAYLNRTTGRLDHCFSPRTSACYSRVPRCDHSQYICHEKGGAA